MKKVKRAGLYSRVSTLEQSTAAQENELKEFAKNRGWNVARGYSDTISGTKESAGNLFPSRSRSIHRDVGTEGRGVATATIETINNHYKSIVFLERGLPSV